MASTLSCSCSWIFGASLLAIALFRSVDGLALGHRRPREIIPTMWRNQDLGNTMRGSELVDYPNPPAAAKKPKCVDVHENCTAKRCDEEGWVHVYRLCGNGTDRGTRVHRRSYTCFKECNKCRNPGPIKNGNRTSTADFVDSITYSCVEGYGLVGTREMECYKGKWSTAKPKCYKKKKEYQLAWTAWESCSSRCGPGVQVRRTVACSLLSGARISKRCREESRICNLKPCKEDFPRTTYGWSKFTGCIAGERFRFRLATPGENCARWFVKMPQAPGQGDRRLCVESQQCCSAFHRSLHSYTVNEKRTAKADQLCKKGFYSKDGFTDAKGGCKPCPIGRYSACKGSTHCSYCPPGYDTKLTNSTMLQQCRKIVPSNELVDGSVSLW